MPIRIQHSTVPHVLSLFLLLAGWMPGSAPAAEAVPAKPNFVLILADDLGYGDLGCYGSDAVETPNIDRMASQGMRFTRFYMAESVCSPSRGALLTGSYPSRVGFTFNHPPVMFPDDDKGLNPSHVTLAQALKNEGYATALIGKWHLGDRPPYTPTHHGFDLFFGIPYSNDMIPPRFPDLPLLRNQEVVERNPDQDHLTSRFTREAVSFIETRSDGRPFFLFLSHPMPHRPVHVSPRFEQGIDPELLASIDDTKKISRDFLYNAAIRELDWSVGEVLDALRRAGLEKDTLVVFTSDNGPIVGSSGPLRGGKGTFYEGGFRVPMIARWPGVVPAGIVNGEMATAMDFYPTFIRLSGGEPTTHRPIDGHDMLPLLRNEPEATTPYRDFYYTRGGEVYGVSLGDWKLVNRRLPRPTTLHDLSTDPGEQIDLSAQHPELKAKLMTMAAEFEASVPARGPDRQSGLQE